MFIPEAQQRALGVGLVVGQRLPLHPAPDVMEPLHLMGDRKPSRRDALRRPIERLGDLAQRTDPVRPLGRGEVTGLGDRRDGVRVSVVVTRSTHCG